MAIVAKSVAVDLAGRRVLHAVDAAIERGEVLGIVGPNGAGKTTLLQAFAGLLPPQQGDVTFDGQSARQCGRRALAARVAFLAQDGSTAWAVTVEAVVGLGRLPHRRPFAGETGADRAAVARAMALCDVAAFAGRPVGSLSGGERRRVLLARALAVQSAYLLVDEPLAGLDPGHQLDTLRLLKAIAAAGTGAAIVLHDLSLAARFCDRLLLLDHGRLIAEGSPDTVLNDERLADVFGIRAWRGSHDGTPFILPWTTAKRRGTAHD